MKGSARRPASLRHWHVQRTCLSDQLQPTCFSPCLQSPSLQAEPIVTIPAATGSPESHASLNSELGGVLEPRFRSLEACSRTLKCNPHGHGPSNMGGEGFIKRRKPLRAREKSLARCPLYALLPTPQLSAGHGHSPKESVFCSLLPT